MPAPEIILLIIRWAHALAAVFWIGGSLFLLLAGRPALRRTDAGGVVGRALGAEFRPLVRTAIAVLIITGVILAATRLTSDAAGIAYIVALAVKIALSLYAFAIAWRMPAAADRAATGRTRAGRFRRILLGPSALAVIGVAVIGLADVLAWLFERNLAG